MEFAKKKKMLQDVKKEMRSKYDQDEMAYRKRSVGNCRYTSNKIEMGVAYTILCVQ